MELRQLNYFLEIARHQSITKAAEVLHISQPALSKMIKSLEQELQMTLMVRSNKTSEITDAGMVVMQYAKKINEQLADMSTVLNELTELERGEIHIGLPPIIGSLFFPNVLSTFHNYYPNIKITITEYGGAKVVKSVEEGELDVGVAVLPVDRTLFHTYPLVQEAMKVVVHYEHHLASRSTVDLSELEQEEFIFYHEDFALHDIMWEQFIKAGYEPQILFKSSHWDLMTEMVAANLGITILPESICKKANNPNVKIIELTPYIPWDLAVITKKDKYISYASRAFIEFVKQVSDDA
ncbi:LysR family transcriptional regulator [Aquibacillus sediminis]|uniref:LysR family transcriptional regulator n=1 Tax=Aquibacillus sediminis TaxID=2574734 RepID=UPI00110A0252|nr:LysR family transcriptional regulator [Aquibacillus sediminis]